MGTPLMEDITECMRLKHECDLNDGTLHRLVEARTHKANGASSRNGCDDKPYRKNVHHRNHANESSYDRRRDGSPARKSYRRRTQVRRPSSGTPF